MKPEYRPIPRNELVFDVKMGLRRARKFLPRRGDQGSDDSLGLAAQQIVEHLELAGVRCFRRPPLKAHSTGASAADASLETHRFSRDT